MIQDIEPKIFDNAYHPRPITAEDFVLLYYENKLWMIKEEAGFRYLIWKEYKVLFQNKKELQYLFEIDKRAFYLECLAKERLEEYERIEEPFIKLSLQPVSCLRDVVLPWMSLAGVTAGHLAKWYKRNTYCGSCRGKMIHSKTERAMLCPDCGFIDYPKICPAVIVGIIDGDRLLLTKYKRPNARYALVAGFCEIGESLEETVRREVKEEVGLEVKHIRYFKSQPWGFSESLLMGFFAELDGSGQVLLDRQELALAEWVRREDLPDDEEKELTLTYTMISAFKRGEYPEKSCDFERRNL